MRTVQSVLRLALCFARCLAAPFPGTNQSLYHREREEDKEMAEFLQNKLSKSYLQKASRWLMNCIPPIEPPCQFLPSLSTLFTRVHCSLWGELTWRPSVGGGGCGEMASLGCWCLRSYCGSITNRCASIYPPGTSQPAWPMRTRTSGCPFMVHVLHLTFSNHPLPFHHS